MPFISNISDELVKRRVALHHASLLLNETLKGNLKFLNGSKQSHSLTEVKVSWQYSTSLVVSL